MCFVRGMGTGRGGWVWWAGWPGWGGLGWLVGAEWAGVAGWVGRAGACWDWAGWAVLGWPLGSAPVGCLGRVVLPAVWAGLSRCDAMVWTFSKTPHKPSLEHFHTTLVRSYLLVSIAVKYRCV